MHRISFNILLIYFLVGCITTDVNPEVNARTAFDEFLAAVEKGRISEVWFRLSFTVREKISFKQFTDDWTNVKNRITSRVKNAEIYNIKEYQTSHNLLSSVFILRDSQGGKKEFMLVAEFDSKRFPGEIKGLWRIRGFIGPEPEYLYGLFPRPIDKK